MRMLAYVCMHTYAKFKKEDSSIPLSKKGGDFPKFFLLFFFRKIAKNGCALARTLSHVLAHARAGVYVSAYGGVGVGMCRYAHPRGCVCMPVGMYVYAHSHMPMCMCESMNKIL